MLSFAGVVLGIALLIVGGGLLVRGACEIATGFGISPMIIGLTIVGLGTSSPELVVNVVGALNGTTDIAFGNVVGSNISNLGLVLGTAAMFSTIRIQGTLVRREIPLLLLATTMTMVMALDGPLEGRPAAIGRTDSLILILTFFIFIYIIALDIVRIRNEDPLLDEIGTEPLTRAPAKSPYCWYFVIGGFALLMVGGELTIHNGVALATQLGVSQAIVGLFVVAVGTSMPELVTSIIAAVRRESDLALGNVIGSNLFNSLMVLPTGGVIAQLPVPRGGVGDLVVSWLLTAALIPLFFYGRAILGRVSGGAFLLVYFGYAIYRFVNT